MKVTKEVGDKELSVYQPDEKEQELIGEVSDKIIDLMDEHELNDDQRIHLISALFVVMKEIYGIEKIQHFDSPSAEEVKE